MISDLSGKTISPREVIRVFLSYEDYNNRRFQIWSIPEYSQFGFSCGYCGVNYPKEYVGRTSRNFTRLCKHCTGLVLTCEFCGLEYIRDSRCQCMQPYPYHKSPTRKLWARPEPGDFGMEIELNCRNFSKIIKVCNEEQWACERDGSLDDEEGVELISGAMPYQDLKKSIKRLFPQIKDHCDGWEAGEDYGIHISFHSEGITRPHLARFTQFINENPLRLGEFIAGRNIKETAKFLSKKGLNIGDALYCPDKYHAVNTSKLPRVEVRIFRSTLHLGSLLANLEFVKSGIQFSEQKFSDDNRVLVEDYIKFLGSKKSFSNLKNKFGRFINSKKSNGFDSLCSLIPLTWSKNVSSRSLSSR